MKPLPWRRWHRMTVVFIDNNTTHNRGTHLRTTHHTPHTTPHHTTHHTTHPPWHPHLASFSVNVTQTNLFALKSCTRIYIWYGLSTAHEWQIEYDIWNCSIPTLVRIVSVCCTTNAKTKFDYFKFFTIVWKRFRDVALNSECISFKNRNTQVGTSFHNSQTLIPSKYCNPDKNPEKK